MMKVAASFIHSSQLGKRLTRTKNKAIRKSICKRQVDWRRFGCSWTQMLLDKSGAGTFAKCLHLPSSRPMITAPSPIQVLPLTSYLTTSFHYSLNCSTQPVSSFHIAVFLHVILISLDWRKIVSFLSTSDHC